MRKFLKIAGFVLGAIILLFAAAALILFLDKPLIKNIVRSQLEKRSGMAVRLGRLDYSFSPFRFTIDSLELRDETAFSKRDLTIAHVAGEGDVWKLVRGEKPTLEMIEAAGIVFRLEQKASSGEPTDYEALIRQASDLLAWAKKISVKDASLSFFLPGQQGGLDVSDVALTTGDQAGDLAYSIGHGRIRVEEKEKSLLFTSDVISSGTMRLASPYGLEAAFTFPAPRFAAGGIENSLPDVSSAITGRFDGSTRTFTVTRLNFRLPGLLEFKGAGKGRLGDDAFLEAEAQADVDKLENIIALIGPRLPAGTRSARLRGRAVLSGKYDLRRLNREWKDDLTASLTLEGVELDKMIDGLSLRLRTDGRIDAAGSSQDPRFSADIRSSLGKISSAGLFVTPSDIHIVAAGSKSGAEISRFDARLDGLEYDAGKGKKISCDKATLAGTGSLDFVRKNAGLKSIDARLTGLVIDAAEGKRISFGETTVTGTGNMDLGRRKIDPASIKARFEGFVFDAPDGKKISLGETIVTAEGNLDLDRKTADLMSLETVFPGLAPLRMSGEFDFSKNNSVEVRAESRGLDIAAVRAIAAPFIPTEFSSWNFSGAADVSAAVRRPAISGDGWSFSGTVSLAGAAFNDPSFSIAGEGLDPVFTFEGFRSTAKSVSFTGTLNVGKGESLWKSFYIPWGKHPLTATVGGRYDSDSGDLAGLSARFILPTIGEVGVNGSARIGPAPSFDLRTEARLDLAPLYSLYSQTGVSEAARMTIAGTFGAVLLVRKAGDALSVGGQVTLTDTKIERPETKILLLGIQADIPLRYETGKTDAVLRNAPLTEQGFLHIGEFQTPLLNLKSVVVTLRSGPNALAVEPLSLELYGGQIELGRTTFRFDPSTASFLGLGSLAVRDIDISRLPIPSPEIKLTGRFRAEFPRLEISPEKISVSGSGEAEVFGGKAVLRDFAVSDPFAAGRSFSLNVDLVDLDLKKLTDEVPFGEVTGIIRGEIRGLVITYQQPARFDFRIESVPRKGVPQTFSLKAVDNLTVLSAGEPASMGTGRFWMRFIRGFRYKQLGIVSTLRNDTFTLNGTIHEGGVEYLVKKPALFGISVVNRMPEKLISFKEMTGRLKRIGRSQK